VANYLDDLTTYSDRAIVAIGNEAYAAALKISLTGEAACEVDNVNWWQQLLSFANNTDLDTPAGNSDLRLTLLTLLVNNAKLFDVQAPQNIYGIYQPIGSGTGTGDAVWGQISGDINDQTDLIAKFNTYLLLAGGTMTGNLLLSGSTRIDRSTASQLNIGTSTASSVAIGRTGQPIQLQGIVTQGIWNGTQIGYQYGGTGLTTIGTAGQSIRVNSGATGYEFFTPGTGSGDVAGPGDSTSTDNAIVRWDGAGGRTIQNSTVLISDSGVVTGVLSITINGGTSGAIAISAPGAVGGRTQTLQAASGVIALDANRLDFFAATTSAQLITKITDPQGTGSLVFATSPTLTTPNIGQATGTSLVLAGSITSGVASSASGTVVLRNSANNFTQTVRGTGTASSIIFDLPTALPTAGQVLTAAAPSAGATQLSWTTITALVNPMTTLGDLIYGAAAGAPTRLAGDTSNTRKFLRELSVAGVATAPVWDTLLAADIPTIAQSQVSGLVASLSGKVSTNLTQGKILIGNLSDLASPVTPSGDWTITYAGVNTIGANKVLFSKFQQATGPQLLVGTPDILGAQDFRQITLDPATLNISALGVLTATSGGSGTVTNTGTLTANALVLGNGGVDVKVGAGFTTDGTSKLTIGVAGSSVGGVLLTNATSGTVELRPVTGALGTSVLSLPVGTDTLVGLALSQALTNKTLTASSNVLGGVTMTLGSDATGDIYYRSGGGVLTRLGIGSTGQALKVSGGLPAWGAAGASVVNSSFTSQTSVTINHSLGYYPIVQAIDNAGALLIPATVVHASTSQFTITFASSTTGNILYI